MKNWNKKAPRSTFPLFGGKRVTPSVEGLDKFVSKGSKLTKKASEQLLRQLEKQMKEAARELDFEKAAELRDTILELKAEMEVL